MQLRSGKSLPSANNVNSIHTHHSNMNMDMDMDISNSSHLEYSLNTKNDIFTITENYNKVVISRLVPLLNKMNKKIYKINKKQKKIIDNDFASNNSFNDYTRYIKKEIKYYSNMFSLLNFYHEIVFYHQNNGVITLENDDDSSSNDFTLHLYDVEKIIQKIDYYIYEVLYDNYLVKKAKKLQKKIKGFHKLFQKEFQMENKNKSKNNNNNNNLNGK